MSTERPAALVDAAARAHDALSVSDQMLAMLDEYTALEAQHATRLRALTFRMGDCVDRMRPQEQQQEDHVLQSQCVAVMDEVVTFLTRVASMHAHLSECLASDLFDEWRDALAVQQKRMDAQEPELNDAQMELQGAEASYRAAHSAFQTDFDRACAEYANLSTAKDQQDDDDDPIERAVQDELASRGTSDEQIQRRTRSPSKAMQYVGSLSRLLRPATDHRDAHMAVRDMADAILRAEATRQQCHDTYEAMHRLDVRYKRLCDSLYQEYRCVQSECLASTRTSIRKLVIHVSAFTSNLQYDATQLFQHVEALHATDACVAPAISPLVIPTNAERAQRSVPSPLVDVPLALEHILRRRFPIRNDRPRLLRHQNACHVLAV